MFFNHNKLKSPFNYLSRGFTLTEVLVIVLVIAVLMAIAYPLYTKAISKARAVEAINLLEIVRTKQVTQYVRTRGYYNNFADMGQLTNNKAAEHANGTSITINDYTVKIDNQKECLTAEYDKGGVKFTMSASYSKEGLGCTGSICESFGSVVGSADDVCHCKNTCASGFQNPDTCECGECNPGLTGACGNCGTKTCGDDYHWGSSCSGEGVCSPGDTPNTNGCIRGGSRKCTNCTWGECTGEGVCDPGDIQTCGTCGTQTCGSNYQWGSCTEAQQGDKTETCGGTGSRSISYSCVNTSNPVTATWTPNRGECECPPGQEMIDDVCATPCACEDGDTDPDDCPAGQQKTCSNCQWGSCGCPAGQVYGVYTKSCYCKNDCRAEYIYNNVALTDCNSAGEWEGANPFPYNGRPDDYDIWHSGSNTQRNSKRCANSNGTWNGPSGSPSCECDCGPNKEWSQSERICVCKNANTTISGTTLKEGCETEDTQRGYGKGTWNDTTCSCDCPAGTAWDPVYGRCIPSSNCAPFWQYGSGIYTAGNGDRYLSYGIYYCGMQGKLYKEEDSYIDNIRVYNCYCQPCNDIYTYPPECLEHYFSGTFGGYGYRCKTSFPACSEYNATRELYINQNTLAINGATMRMETCVDNAGNPTGKTKIWYWEGCPSNWVQQSGCE